jgi:uncharacterized protein YndB with AHSA1/START domain
MQFSITTEVDAPPEVVFAVLVEVERWPEWTPTVTSVERLDGGGPLALGGRLRIVQPKVPPAEWTVTAFEPGRGFRLFSRSPGATVEANHWAEPAAGGSRSRVTLSVTFAGFLGRVIGWVMRGLNERYLADEAAGLKRRCEERARGTE